MPRPSLRLSRSTARLGAAALAAGLLAACGGEDPFAPKAQFETVLGEFRVYPLTSAPTAFPTAVSLYTQTSVRPAVRTNLTLNFDVAVDLDAQGRVRFLPPKLVVAPQTTALVTGFQIVPNTTFDALTRAPTGGYQYDSAAVVTPGQVLAVQTQGAAPLSVACSPTAPMYAKIVVDSIRPSAGSQQIFFRARVDQNCGFRSLEPGLPGS